MDYYNVEHPDYYTRETKVCSECGEEFPTRDGAEFFYHVNGKDHSFCCETCMCNSWVYYFNIVHFDYAGNMHDFVFDNDFTCSHAEFFAKEWEAYKEKVKNAML